MQERLCYELLKKEENSYRGAKLTRFISSPKLEQNCSNQHFFFFSLTLHYTTYRGFKLQVSMGHIQEHGHDLIYLLHIP